MNEQLTLPEPDDSFFGPVIYAYTRAQSLADGILVDVTETAKEAGYKRPAPLRRVKPLLHILIRHLGWINFMTAFRMR